MMNIKKEEEKRNENQRKNSKKCRGLIGENGAGKTSIMRILVGLTKKYEGIVRGNQIERLCDRVLLVHKGTLSDEINLDIKGNMLHIQISTN